jgi:hypothetical protein
MIVIIITIICFFLNFMLKIDIKLKGFSNLEKDKILFVTLPLF